VGGALENDGGFVS